MAYAQTAILVDLVREAAHPLVGDKDDYDPLLAMIGDARVSLPGPRPSPAALSGP